MQGEFFVQSNPLSAVSCTCTLEYNEFELMGTNGGSQSIIIHSSSSSSCHISLHTMLSLLYIAIVGAWRTQGQRWDHRRDITSTVLLRLQTTSPISNSVDPPCSSPAGLSPLWTPLCVSGREPSLSAAHTCTCIRETGLSGCMDAYTWPTRGSQVQSSLASRFSLALCLSSREDLPLRPRR